MASREATCSCGRLRLTAEGEPVRVSVCHCLGCQRRSGSGPEPDMVAVPLSAFADPAFPGTDAIGLGVADAFVGDGANRNRTRPSVDRPG